MAKFEVGDIVLYDPPDRTAPDCSQRFFYGVGVVTDELTGTPPRPAEPGETHVNWISLPNLVGKHQTPSRHYTKNLRKLGHITPEVHDGSV